MRANPALQGTHQKRHAPEGEKINSIQHDSPAAESVCVAHRDSLWRGYLGLIDASILLGPKTSADAMVIACSFPNSCSTTYNEAS